MYETKNKVTDIDTARQKLAQIRDELKLNLHLAKMDARNEWDELETKWQRFEGKARLAQTQGEDVAEEVWEDVQQLGQTLRQGYERIRKSF